MSLVQLYLCIVDEYCVYFTDEAESRFEQHCPPLAPFDNCISHLTIHVHGISYFTIHVDEIQWQLG